MYCTHGILFCSNGTEPTPHCQVEKTTGNLPMFWGWVAQATYIGKKEIHEIEYDAWGYEVKQASVTSMALSCNP